MSNIQRKTVVTRSKNSKRKEGKENDKKISVVVEEEKTDKIEYNTNISELGPCGIIKINKVNKREVCQGKETIKKLKSTSKRLNIQKKEKENNTPKKDKKNKLFDWSSSDTDKEIVYTESDDSPYVNEESSTESTHITVQTSRLPLPTFSPRAVLMYSAAVGGEGAVALQLREAAPGELDTARDDCNNIHILVQKNCLGSACFLASILTQITEIHYVFFIFTHLLNLPWTSTNNSKPKLAKSVQPFSGFSETNEQQLIFIYIDKIRSY
ncbi:hypothetical protein K1T71_010708 [Dendrolimus kikuchii]|uniref:Uncharacterized protein n=1 Tax=Dendrolimus kikuchii TaxID=765133 RepID=A0ACC1CQ99_9NEOP|nr:hypothetical protein K1T71_010708 [Dendrolimus kikuchii]